MLEVGYTLVPAIAKNFAIHRVIGHTQLTPLITVTDVNNLDGICQERDAMRFCQLQHDNFIGMAVDSEYGVGATVELFYTFLDRAIKDFIAIQHES